MSDQVQILARNGRQLTLMLNLEIYGRLSRSITLLEIEYENLEPFHQHRSCTMFYELSGSFRPSENVQE